MTFEPFDDVVDVGDGDEDDDDNDDDEDNDDTDCETVLSLSCNDNDGNFGNIIDGTDTGNDDIYADHTDDDDGDIDDGNYFLLPHFLRRQRRLLRFDRQETKFFDLPRNVIFVSNASTSLGSDLSKRKLIWFRVSCFDLWTRTIFLLCLLYADMTF